MEVENLSPFLGSIMVNLIIDVTFVIIILAIAFWQLRKVIKKDRLRTDLMKQIIKDKQSENRELEREILKLRKIMIVQNLLEEWGDW